MNNLYSSVIAVKPGENILSFVDGVIDSSRYFVIRVQVRKLLVLHCLFFVLIDVYIQFSACRIPHLLVVRW